jgi:hypothetical protein
MTNSRGGQWIELGIPAPEPQHVCLLPPTDAARVASAGVGAIWECGECQERWRITEVIASDVFGDDRPPMPEVFSWSRA